MLVQIQHACEHTGFFAVTHHGCPIADLTGTFTAARPVFDLPRQAKQQLVVHGMRAGRGYEVSPEHHAYDAYVADVRRRDPAVDAALRNHPEASVREGLMSERFMCGPPASPGSMQQGELRPDDAEIDKVRLASPAQQKAAARFYFQK